MNCLIACLQVKIGMKRFLVLKHCAFNLITAAYLHGFWFLEEFIAPCMSFFAFPLEIEIDLAFSLLKDFGYAICGEDIVE